MAKYMEMELKGIISFSELLGAVKPPVSKENKDKEEKKDGTIVQNSK